MYIVKLLTNPMNLSKECMIFSAGANYGVQSTYETSENEFDQPLHHVFEQVRNFYKRFRTGVAFSTYIFEQMKRFIHMLSNSWSVFRHIFSNRWNLLCICFGRDEAFSIFSNRLGISTHAFEQMKRFRHIFSNRLGVCKVSEQVMQVFSILLNRLRIFRWPLCFVYLRWFSIMWQIFQAPKNLSKISNSIQRFLSSSVLSNHCFCANVLI
jgi:hypothetical protein